MKSTISKLLLASAVTLSVHASATTLSETQYANNVSLTLGDDTIYNGFTSFDSTKGTLNSVTFYIDSVNVSGEINVTQTGTFTATVSQFLSEVKLYSGVVGSGYNGLSSVFDLKNIALTVSPSISALSPVYVDKFTPADFTVSLQNIIPTGYSFDVSTGNYTGAGSAPSFKLYTDVSADANFNNKTTFIYDGAVPVQAVANLRLVYDYTAFAPVPEPSTYGIGLGVLALAAVAIRRRKVKA
jgi:hypothetical protein